MPTFFGNRNLHACLVTNRRMIKLSDNTHKSYRGPPKNMAIRRIVKKTLQALPKKQASLSRKCINFLQVLQLYVSPPAVKRIADCSRSAAAGAFGKLLA